jgi:hypothetical protein
MLLLQKVVLLLFYAVSYLGLKIKVNATTGLFSISHKHVALLWHSTGLFSGGYMNETDFFHICDRLLLQWPSYLNTQLPALNTDYY